MAYFELRPTCASPDYPIYGAEWAGTSDPSWTRTDAASSFSDPNPYYAGMSGTPSSPFDNISPWKDLVVSEDSEAGTLVSIPKFYFKWTRTGDKMKLQISMHQYDGFLCSPAHADRGDGKGERDIAYVARYKCASDYKSKTGVLPKENETRVAFRNGIHNLGTTVWQNDFAIRWTVLMLYLVEYAHWNSQAKIGGGCSSSGSRMNMGYTDNMPYHTGTTATSISATVYGGTQYRHIEGWWDNIWEWCDGIYFSGTDVFCIKNPANFADNTGGTNVGTRGNASTFITTWSNPSVSGFEYALYPTNNSGGSESTYVCDMCNYNSTANAIRMGGDNGTGITRGAFAFFGDSTASSPYNYIGSRLMKLP